MENCTGLHANVDCISAPAAPAVAAAPQTAQTEKPKVWMTSILRCQLTICCISPAACAKPKKTLEMTACFSPRPMTQLLNASPPLTSTRVAWPDMASRSDRIAHLPMVEVNHTWRWGLHDCLHNWIWCFGLKSASLAWWQLVWSCLTWCEASRTMCHWGICTFDILSILKLEFTGLFVHIDKDTYMHPCEH